MIVKIIKWIFGENLTFSRGKREIHQIREVETHPKREVRPASDSLSCPYCLSTNFQKRGFRQKKLEKVQLYLCLDCNKTFTDEGVYLVNKNKEKIERIRPEV